MSVNRRQAEEIMLKLLMNQFKAFDIQTIVSYLKQDRRYMDKDIHHYFSKHIEPFCNQNFLKVIRAIDEGNQKLLKDFIELFNNASLFKELIDEIRRSHRDNQKSLYSPIPNYLLLSFLKYFKGELRSKRVEEVVGHRLLFDLMRNGDKSTQEMIIKFLNKRYSANDIFDQEDFFLKMMHEASLNKTKMLHIKAKLFEVNQSKGAPTLFIQEKDEDYQFKCVIDNVGEQNCDKRMTLYQLLFILMLKANTNIDLYDIYFKAKTNTAALLDNRHAKYLTSIGELFKQPSSRDIVHIELKPKQKDALHDKTLYFDNFNILKPSTKKQLSKLFIEKHNLRIKPHCLFDFLCCKELNDLIESLFHTSTVIQFEQLVAVLNNQTRECLILLHLLIGFAKGEINRPYLRTLNEEITLKTKDYAFCASETRNE